MSKPNYRRDSALKNFMESLHGCNPCTVFIVIIDNFTMLGSAYGYSEADSLIAFLCEKIADKIGTTHRVADNSLLVIQHETDTEKNKATKTALKKLINEFSLKHSQETAAHISTIINFAQINSGESAAEIFDRLYSPGTEPTDRKHSRAEMAMANEITAALDNQRLQLAYQPVIEAKTGHTHSYECLLRIIDNNGNASSAGSFIHIAEKMGIIERIDLYVLDMVFDKIEADKNIRLSFNISNLSLGSKAWSRSFFERITPEIANRLTIEITETAMMLNLSATAYFIARLQEAGAAVALDDFGSGYTSFRQIRSLSLDYVKIDGSLIHDIATNHHNQLLVKSLLEFLKGLKLKTVAEFVDGGDTAKYLINAGIDYMQGNYFGEAKVA